MPKLRFFRIFRGLAIIVIAATFGIGFAAGFYFVFYSHQQIQTMGATGYILAGFSGLGLMVTLYGAVNTWANTPRLGSKNLYSKDNIHYLRYEKTAGKGMVLRGVLGFLIQIHPRLLTVLQRYGKMVEKENVILVILLDYVCLESKESKSIPFLPLG
ncbi:MAG: hypothetical protein WBZ36_01800 [Candidatus Nitrosopolaris sp.]